MNHSTYTHRFLAIALLVFLVATSVVGCSKATGNRSDYAGTSWISTTGSDSTGNLMSKDAMNGLSSSPVPDVTATDSTVDRKIIFSASLALDVDDAQKAFTDCQALVAKYGGFVAQSSLQKSDVRVTATSTLRVPSAKATELMDDIAKLGVVSSRSSGSDDITSQYIDIEARLKVLRAEEEQLVGFLRRATTIKDMLAVQDQLISVRTSIEQYEGQQRYMDNATSLATINVQFSQVAEVFVAPRGFGSAFIQSLAKFGHGIAAFWTWLGGSIVFLAFYGLLLCAVAWILSKITRPRKHRSLPPQS